MYVILALHFEEQGLISRTSNSFLILKLKQVFWHLGGGVIWGDGDRSNDDLGGGDWKGGGSGGGDDSGISPSQSGE